MVQLEDQTFPKRCGHLAGKEVVPRDASALAAEVLLGRSQAFAPLVHEAKPHPGQALVARADEITAVSDTVMRIRLKKPFAPMKPAWTLSSMLRRPS